MTFLPNFCVVAKKYNAASWFVLECRPLKESLLQSMSSGTCFSGRRISIGSDGWSVAAVEAERRHPQYKNQSFLRRTVIDMSDLELSKHSFLAELGIEAENLGVFNGDKWCGSGPVITTYNPTTGAPIARVKGVRTYIRPLINSFRKQSSWRLYSANGDFERIQKSEFPVLLVPTNIHPSL